MNKLHIVRPDGESETYMAATSPKVYRQEFQGKGTYEYACDEPGCEFCYLMGLKPKPEKESKPFVYILPAAPVQEDVIHVVRKDPYFTMSNYRRKKLRDLECARPTIKPSFMKQDHTY